MKKICAFLCFLLIAIVGFAPNAEAWFDETHMAIAKAAGYRKWYNAAAADVCRIKLGKMEGYNHYHNSPKGTVITPSLVLEQADRYDTRNPSGHLYGAIIGSYRAYRKVKAKGRYAENHMAYLVHYVGDLSMPLHHTLFNAFNKRTHLANDGIIEDQVLTNINRIRVTPIHIASEQDLAKAVADIANQAKRLGHVLEAENRLMTPDEAYRQIGLSASLLKGILAYVESL